MERNVASADINCEVLEFEYIKFMRHSQNKKIRCSGKCLIGAITLKERETVEHGEAGELRSMMI